MLDELVAVTERAWTEEQLAAIERRRGDLLLDAGAGSGKTSVLVERFARSVLEDGIDIGAILTITFTDKAAAELRERIRLRLHELGATEAARATEGAFISTIHGFCARVLRTHALAAGIDPRFVILEAPDAQQVARAALDDALEALTHEPGGVDLIASYGLGPLRAAIAAAHDELRSRGSTLPALPPLAQAPELEPLRDELEAARARVAVELAEVADPGVRVLEALARLERAAGVIAGGVPWPGELDALSLPSGNGAALSTAACASYSEALGRFRAGCELRIARGTHAMLDRLLRDFGQRYARRKRAASALDFEDLELMTRDLLAGRAELRERYATRFEQIMVDELQDTNAVQLELIESIARGNLFTVGDAQQSIYGFRHADVELFERRGARLEAVGARATLRTNFRSRAEILAVLNAAFADEERFMPLLAGRVDPPVEDPRVELLIADKAADWQLEGLAAPWRTAEALALAARVRELVDGGAAQRDIVVLTRATTDLRAYERALEEQGVATYVIGGRGYWSHPQVVDLVSYLRALANPRDEEALYTTLASPLVGVSLDGLVVLAAAARAGGRDPWWTLREPDGALDPLDEPDRAKLDAFAGWFARERDAAARAGVEELIERALCATGYDLRMLAMPGGRRRLANVRKLMRLGREHEQAHGPDLRSFLDLVHGRSAGWSGFGDPRESEAPVEGEALDAVRLMTIHRAKGLEFPIVCVADLGRVPWRTAELLRIGRDGRLGLRLSEPGTSRPIPALDYQALGDERRAAEEREEHRLFYVAMTRARERLILSGAVRVERWEAGGGSEPLAWIGPALVPDIAARAEEGSGLQGGAVAFTFIQPGPTGGSAPPALPATGSAQSPSPDFSPPSTPPAAPPAPPAPAQASPPPAPALSYSSLGEYRRCGYRFYVERVLGLPARRDRRPAGATAGVGATDRGIILHALLERLDFRVPSRPDAATVAAAGVAAGVSLSEREVDEIAGLVHGFAQSPLAARLARVRDLRREERFSFALPGGVLMRGAIDVLAREPGGRSLIVDYKSDRLDAGDPITIVAREYAVQRLVYALAALRAGAAAVEVAHVFLQVPDAPVFASFTAADAPRLEAELTALADGVVQRRFPVTDVPHALLCSGCPAEGGLCSWPLAMTRREEPDRLF